MSLDENPGPLIVIILLMCIVAAGVVIYYDMQPSTATQNQKSSILNATPTPTITNSSPTPIVNTSPTPNTSVEPDYNDYLLYIATHDVKGNSTPQNIAGMMSYDEWKQIVADGVITTPILAGDPAYENGNRYYDPKATPTPTPTIIPTIDPLSYEKHTLIRAGDMVDAHAGEMSQVPGPLALDAEHSYAGYSYYYTSPNPSTCDVIDLQLRLVNQYLTPLHVTSVHVTVNRTYGLNEWTIYDQTNSLNITIQPIEDGYGNMVYGAYTYPFIQAIPSSSSGGNTGYYDVTIKVYASMNKPDDTLAITLRKSFDIFWKPD